MENERTIEILYREEILYAIFKEGKEVVWSTFGMQINFDITLAKWLYDGKIR